MPRLKNITSILFDQIQRRPGALAIRHASGNISYGEFGARVAGAAAGLAEAGVNVGDVVALLLDDPLDHWLATLAVAHSGATVVSIPRSMSTTQCQRLLAHTRCSWLLSDDETTIERVTHLRWSAIRDYAGDALLLPAVVNAVQPWICVSASGSTGQPKIIPVTHEQELARTRASHSCLPYGSEDCVHTMVAMHFSHAKRRSFEAFSRAAAISLIRQNSVGFRAEIKGGLITVLDGTPYHFESLLKQLPAPEKLDFSRLKALIVSAAPVTMSLRQRLRDHISSNVYVRWGTNESGTATITSPSEVFRVHDTVGRPAPGFKFEVVDQNDCPVPPGVPGLIRVSSNTLITGYLDDEEATFKAFRDGWFYPGDIGYVTPDGQLVHRGRADDMMIVSGLNVYPAEVEASLRSISGVADVLVKPLRHPEVQDVPVALVVREPGAALDAKVLIQQVRDQIGHHNLYDLVFLNRIPRNEQGKIQGEVVQQILLEKWGGVSKPAPKPAPLSTASAEGAFRATVSLGFKLPQHANARAVCAWLAVLDEELLPARSEQATSTSVDEGRQWLDLVLTLAMGLLNALRVPVFETLEVVSCQPTRNDKGGWEAVCRLPDAALVSRAVMDGILKASFRLVAIASSTDVDSAVERASFFGAIQKDVLQAFASARPNGKSAFEVLKVAHRIGVPYLPLPGGAFQLGWGCNARRIDRSTTDRDSAMGVRWTQNKLLTAQMLRQAGLPGPVHLRVASVEQARLAAERLGYPVVVKPADLERGEGVSVDVCAAGLEAAFNTAQQRSPGKQVLVEQQVPGVCHRLFIVAGKLLYAVRRLPIGVYADGRSTIRELVAAECEIQQRLPPWKRSGIRPLDDMAMQMLRRQAWGPDSVPEQGRFVALRRIETTAWGGVDEEVTQTIHPDNVRAATSAAQLFGLEVAGVDIISQDIKHAWHANGAIINEVNYAPLLGGGEISRSRIPLFLDALLKNGGRVPVHVHVGNAKALKAAQETWKRLLNGGLSALLVSAEQVLMPSGEQQMMPLLGLHARCRALALSPETEALVLVVQSDEFMQTGLPFDRITSLHEAEGALVSFPQGRPLDAARTNSVFALLRSWRRDDGVDVITVVGTTEGFAVEGA